MQTEEDWQEDDVPHVARIAVDMIYEPSADHVSLPRQALVPRDDSRSLTLAPASGRKALVASLPISPKWKSAVIAEAPAECCRARAPEMHKTIRDIFPSFLTTILELYSRPHP